MTARHSAGARGATPRADPKAPSAGNPGPAAPDGLRVPEGRCNGLQPPAQPSWLPSAISLPTRDELAAIFDVTTNGQAMLSAVGGLALTVLGVRTLFGGRRKGPTSRETSREVFRED